MSVLVKPSAFIDSVFIKYTVHIQRWAVPQIENPQICGLEFFVRFADLPQMWHFADLPFADPVFL
jgi:hypothetical protein